MRLPPYPLLCSLLLPLAAAAGPADPVVVERPDDALGAPQLVGFRTLADLPEPYVEEEFFVSGNATVYTYEERPRPTVVLPLEAVPYKSRIAVRRPADPAQFSGTVVIEWWNSTGTFDTSPGWDASAAFFARAGWIYVGLTNSNTSIAFLRNGCRLGGILPVADCRTRYASLSLPENGQAYDLGNQLAALLARGGAESPIPPAYRVERIYHTGTSQQGGSIITLATAFHAAANDGYFVQELSTARPVNARPACGSDGAPAYPACTPQLAGRDRLVRTDLPVPLVHAMTETDVESPFGALANDARQKDTKHFRYYELAGTSHTAVHKGVYVIPGFFTLEQTCTHRQNTLADGPVFGAYLYNAMWSNLDRHARGGPPPPNGKLIETADGAIVRDEYGNARGGLRLPELDVPVATYLPNNEVVESLPPLLSGFRPLLGLFCALTGSVFPFDAETLAALYPSADDYVTPYERRLDWLVHRRFLLPDDAEALRAAAQAGAPFGDGP
jgi:hypothetical protein